MIVDPGGPDDLVGIADIYGRAARTSVATFDLDALPVEHWQGKQAGTGPGKRFLVSRDGRGVTGFAYSNTFRPRPGYARTRETSIYVREDARGRGTGRALYAVLLDRLRADGIHLVVAVVAQPNPASNQLHERLGFSLVGTFDEVGYKFGRYVSTTWYQLQLDRWQSDGVLPPPPQRY